VFAFSTECVDTCGLSLILLSDRWRNKSLKALDSASTQSGGVNKALLA